jgi:hypothetical protein
LLPGAPTGYALKKRLELGTETFLMIQYPAPVTAYYAKARAAAEARNAKRTAFMEERLRAGRHPDTDPNFWDGYREPARPRLPGELAAWGAWFRGDGLLLLIPASLLLAVGTVIFFVVRYIGQARRRRQAEAPRPPVPAS